MLYPSYDSFQKNKDLQEVREYLPTKAHFDKEAREKVLAEGDKERKRKKEGHKMATFRIEVMFSSKRSTQKSNITRLRVWHSGKVLNGKGDESLLWCGSPTCIKPFPASIITDEDHIVCPFCFGVFTKDQLSSNYTVNYTTEQLCLLVSQLFLHLKGDADIMVQWFKEDVRKLTKLEQHIKYEEKKLQKVVYPYWRILEDTADGRSLAVRLKDLLG